MVRLAPALLAVLAGCGGGSSPPPASEIWSRRDAPPAGVAPTTDGSTAQAVGQICADSTGAPARPGEIQLDRRPSDGQGGSLPADRPRLGETLQVCPPHPDDTRPVTLTACAALTAA